MDGQLVGLNQSCIFVTNLKFVEKLKKYAPSLKFNVNCLDPIYFLKRHACKDYKYIHVKITINVLYIKRLTSIKTLNIVFVDINHPTSPTCFV